jgi:ABC-type Mn2+/Zn2+ transport system permease subunit
MLASVMPPMRYNSGKQGGSGMATKRKYQTQKEAGIILAICGVISGLVSAYVSWPGFELFGTPMIPAVAFGLVVALAIYSWEARHPVPMLIVFVGVVIAWWAAYTIAVSLYDEKNKTALIWIGAISGFVGAALTSAALWIASEDFRKTANLTKTVIFGALAGTLLYFIEGGGVIHGLSPLFVIWQAGMAWLIGYALAFRPRPP